MVPMSDAVDERLDALRSSTPVPAPQNAADLCATSLFIDASVGKKCASTRLYFKCLWTKEDWKSWMASVQVRRRSEALFRRRRKASESFGDLFNLQKIEKRPKLNMAQANQVMHYKLTVQNVAAHALPQDVKHVSVELFDVSPSRQNSAYLSAKPAEHPEPENSAYVDSAKWYRNLKRDVETANKTCVGKYEELEEPIAVPGKYVPPELTEEMTAEVDAALKPGPQEDVLSEGYSLVVRRADMFTLSQDQWINDTIINFYMSMLVDRSEKGPLRVYAFNTFFFTKLCRDGHGGLKRWTRKIDLFSYHIILVPIHLSRHWCLAAIDFRGPHIALYDSIGAPYAKSDCIDQLREYLEEESQHKRKHGINWDEWKFIVAEDAPQQQNMNDCGMFTCQFAECISRDAPFQFTQQHMPYFRKRVVYEILHSTLL